MNGSDYRYLELLKLALIDALNPTTQRAISPGDGTLRVEDVPDGERDVRMQGEDWPVNAVTMIGAHRLTNIQQCIETVIDEGIPGDFIETGVWRGGGVIFAAAVLDVEESDRAVWAADSYRGLPEGDGERYPEDADDTHHTLDYLAASLDQVKVNFSRFGVSTKRVRFLKGWFRDTLPGVDERFAVIRLDGDMYESSMLGLEYLYPLLADGGFCIVDDYGVPGCHSATNDYLDRLGIGVDAHAIGDSEAVYWRKGTP